MSNFTINTERIGALAVESMLYEVSATPKPGLVDRHDNGAHNDMDFFTFMSSAAGLRSAFDTFAAIGRDNRQQPVDSLFSKLQQAGLQAERNMFSMTDGINTHKGMIFSLGLLTAIAGWTGDGAYSAETICLRVKNMCTGLCNSAYKNLADKQILTKGEQMFLKYGVTGVRGEVESGFKTVLTTSLPLYRSLRKKSVNVNDALVAVLLQLMADNEDTNILGRHDKATLKDIQKKAKAIVDMGSIMTTEGKQAISALNDYCIAKYISPGGSADLIAVTHFLYELENMTD